MPNEDSSCLTSKSRSHESSEQNSSDSNEAAVIEISAIAKAIDAQRFKFRPLLVHCYSILGFAKVLRFMMVGL